MARLSTLTPAPHICRLPETIRRDQQRPPISTEGPKAAVLHPLMSPRFLSAQQHTHIYTLSLMYTLSHTRHTIRTLFTSPSDPSQ